MVFVLSNHAKQRMIEREVLSPTNQRLFPAGNKIKKRIKEACKKEKLKPSHIYFVRHTKNEETHKRECHVYVCVTLTTNTYLIITCFKFSL